MKRYGMGRAGLPIESRMAPASGGLHAIQIVCHMTGSYDPPRVYLPGRHAFALLPACEEAHGANNASVEATVGRIVGCTFRLIADLEKLAAAYQHPSTLAWRDSGALAATICFVSQWLGLKSNILGFNGDSYLPMIGYTATRFMAVGGVQISK
ncbi:hypothetical protein [Mesorhizobium retamae]|uniref:hypothetical protein n=1 Tax=Mesorhizobium retamae TaxID=2912854 RepID=UPI001EF4DFA9|nr:hypothetical protein [Mesorhizobium sp. IRAMC:0171]